MKCVFEVFFYFIQIKENNVSRPHVESLPGSFITTFWEEKTLKSTM
jgi:hypothetical protein